MFRWADKIGDIVDADNIEVLRDVLRVETKHTGSVPRRFDSTSKLENTPMRLRGQTAQKKHTQRFHSVSQEVVNVKLPAPNYTVACSDATRRSRSRTGDAPEYQLA